MRLFGIADKLHHHQSRQRGGALIIMLVIMVMGATTFLVSSLNKSGLQIERDAKTFEAMAQAKDALISYAINSENNTSETQPRPGNLPCPDTNNDGVEEGSCTAGAIGRLPWKSLGITELTDESGEPLWYAVSGNFRRRSIVANTINSDAPGTLDVYDNSGTILLTPTGSKAVAIIFAPGIIVGSQQRTSVTDKTTNSNYLDIGPNGRDNATGPFISANKSDTFNDRLIFITADQLLPSIEKRVGKEIKNLLNTYYAAWSAFPFAAPFSDPTTSPFSGSTGTYNGLPPIGNINAIGTPVTPYWNAVPSVNFIGGSGTASCSLRPTSPTNCALTNTCTYWRCNFTGITGTPTIHITGTLNSIGFGMWRLYDPTASISGTPEVSVRIGTSTTYKTASSVMDNVTVTGSLNTTGNATVTFSGTVRAGQVPARIQLYPNTIPSYSLPLWFGVNNWQQVMYYATSPGHAPGGGSTCSPLPATPSCLTVNGRGGRADTKAIVVLSGNALASQAAHPSGNLANYLEDENATPTDHIYETTTRSSFFNDQVISVSP